MVKLYTFDTQSNAFASHLLNVNFSGNGIMRAYAKHFRKNFAITPSDKSMNYMSVCIIDVIWCDLREYNSLKLIWENFAADKKFKKVQADFC